MKEYKAREATKEELFEIKKIAEEKTGLIRNKINEEEYQQILIESIRSIANDMGLTVTSSNK